MPLNILVWQWKIMYTIVSFVMFSDEGAYKNTYQKKYPSVAEQKHQELYL